MSQPLIASDAAIYAAGLREMNLALDLIEEEIETANTNHTLALHRLFTQKDALTSAIQQWDDMYKQTLSDMILGK